MPLFLSHRVRPTDATPLRRVLRCDLRKPLFRSHRVRPTDATPLRRVDGRHYGQSSIVDETPDGSESRPYRSPFAMPRHRSSIVQSSIVIRPSSHRPIVKVGVITPPLDPLPVQGGDGCWVLSTAPFPGTYRRSSIGCRFAIRFHKSQSPESQHGLIARKGRPRCANGPSVAIILRARLTPSTAPAHRASRGRSRPKNPAAPARRRRARP